MEKLLYTKAECDFYTTPLGFVYCRGINKYEKAVLRNKVVLRVSLAEIICRRHYLTDENLGSSAFLMLVLTGFPNIDNISDNLKLFYKNDERFRRYLSSLYYSKYSTMSQDACYLTLIAEDLMRFIKSEINNFVASTKGSYNIIYKFNTGTDIYLAVDEAWSQTIEVKKDYNMEVISNAKNWIGRVQRSD